MLDLLGGITLNAIMMMRCPDCDAVYFCHGDFINTEGQIIRMSEIPHEDCKKCCAIALECGLE